MLARNSHQPPTAACDSTASSRPSPSSLLQRTASTPQSASGPRSANLQHSHTPRYGVGEKCRLTPRLTTSALLAALLLIPAVGSAWDFSIKGQEFTLDATNTFKYTYHLDNNNGEPQDDEFHQVLNTLDVNLSHGDLRLGLRLDVHGFADTFYPRGCGNFDYQRDCVVNSKRCECSAINSRYRTQVAPERIFLTLARPEFDLTLGDFYASFGKGLALSAVKVGELSQDDAIRGGKLVLHQGRLELVLLGGQFNPLDVDEPTGVNAPWEADPVVAGRVAVNVSEGVIVGAHSVFIPLFPNDMDDTGLTGGPGNYHLMVGTGVELNDLLDGKLSFGAEVDLQRMVRHGEASPGVGDQDLFRGLAVYGVSTLQLGDLTLLGEFKYYNNFELKAEPPKNQKTDPEKVDLAYHRPPTLEWIRAEINNNSDVTGGRLRADYNLGQLGPLELLLFANMGLFQNWDNEGHAERMIFNPFMGAETQWSEGNGVFQLTVGLRREQDTDGGGLYLQDVFAELSLEQGITGSHSFTLSGLIWIREKPPEESWNETEISLSYKWSPRVALDVNYERTGRYEGKQEHFVNGGIKYFFTPGTYAYLRAGQNRPGIKCYSGTCRDYPGFAGVQLALVGRLNDLNSLLN